MQFYNSAGVVVTDTSFITPNGDQYPIRNITSVKIRKQGGRWGWIFLQVTVTVLFISLIPKETDMASEVPQTLRLFNNLFLLFLVNFICFLIWYFNRRCVLLIGSGGVDQTALSFKRWRKRDVDAIHEIAAAINASIANLQKT
jgi:hypothetical protein